MRPKTRSHVYSFSKAIFSPAPQRWSLTRFPRSFGNLTVLGRKDRRSLEVAAAVPSFWKNDGPSLPTFVSFVYVSMRGMLGKHSAGKKKTPRRRGQHLHDGEINVKESDFTKLVQNHLKWLSHSVRFWEKEKQEEQFYDSLYKIISVKKCEAKDLNQASPILVFYLTLQWFHCWACIKRIEPGPPAEKDPV